MELLTVKETAQLLRVSPITVRRYIASGRLEAERVGRGIRIRREAIEHFVTPIVPGSRDSRFIQRGEGLTIREAVGDIIGIGQSKSAPGGADEYEETEEGDDSLGEPTSAEDPLWNIIGLGRSDGPTDVPRNKHKYLAEAILAEMERSATRSELAEEETDNDQVEVPDDFLGEPFTRDDPLWNMMGIGSSHDSPDVATNKHKYLADAILSEIE
jgi:excisionase family DNA binding protein